MERAIKCTSCARRARACHQVHHAARRRSGLRAGFAIKELLLIVGIAAGGGIGLSLLDPLDDAQRDFEALQWLPLFEQEVPVTEEFVCVVSVDALVDPQTSAPSFHRTRLRFVRRQAGSEGAFLFEADCYAKWWQFRTWSFAEAIPSSGVPAAGGETVGVPDIKSLQDRLLTDRLVTPHERIEAGELPDGLWQCVPVERLQTGVLIVSSTCGPDELGRLTDFPIDRLAAAIRTATRDEQWPHADPESLLYAGGAEPLPAEGQRAIAQRFIVRVGNLVSDESL
jgi:hypothetical protein